MTVETTGDTSSETVSVREMVERIDWASTSLGPRESWDRELEDALRFLLESRQPMVVWWGRRNTLLYNDAFVPSAGNLHPSAFARPVAEGWPEVAAHSEADLNKIRTGSKSGLFIQDDMLVLDRQRAPGGDALAVRQHPGPWPVRRGARADHDVQRDDGQGRRRTPDAAAGLAGRDRPRRAVGGRRDRAAGRRAGAGRRGHPVRGVPRPGRRGRTGRGRSLRAAGGLDTERVGPRVRTGAVP